MIVMETGEETILREQQQMFAPRNLEHRLVPVQEETVGAAQIQTGTVGRIWEIHSFMSQPNGEIPMVMDTAMNPMGMKPMHAQQFAVHRFLTDWVAGIQTGTVGPIQQMIGKHTHLA
jgi:hypothetical protein